MIRNTHRSIGKPLKGFGAYSIANQCPISGGSAVFKARAMLYLVMPNLNYNDRDICNRQGIAYKHASPNTTKNIPYVKVHPNPANDLINIEYILVDDCKAKIELYNLLGVVEVTLELPKEKDAIKLNTQKLAQGVYYYRILCNDVVITGGKLAIIR